MIDAPRQEGSRVSTGQKMEYQKVRLETDQTILYDEHGRPTHLKWQKCGQNHRDGGPSWLVINPDTGVHIREHYCVDGRLHRPNRMPAKIHRDPTTGEVEYIAFYENGVQRFWRKINDLALSP